MLELIIPCLLLPERAEKQCWPHLPSFTAVAPIHRASQSLCCISAAATPAPHVTHFFFVTQLTAFEECWCQKEIAQHHEKSHHLPLTMEKPDSYGILKEWRWAESLPTQHTGSKNLLDSHRTREQGAEQPIAGHHRRRALPCADTKDVQVNMQPPRQLPRLGEKRSAGFSFARLPADLRGWVAFTRHTSSLLPRDLGHSVSTITEGTEQGKREKGNAPPYPIHFRPSTSLLLTRMYPCSKHPALVAHPGALRWPSSPQQLCQRLGYLQQGIKPLPSPPSSLKVYPSCGTHKPPLSTAGCLQRQGMLKGPHKSLLSVQIAQH